MKKIFWFIVVLMILFHTVDGNNTDSIVVKNFPTLNSTENKIYGLSKVWSEIKYNFVNIDLLDFAIDSLYEATIPKVLATTNDIDYYDELQRFIAAFNDGHTLLGKVTYDWNEHNDYIPFGIISIEQKMYFSSYRMNVNEPDSLLLGAEILEIEGLPTKDYLKKYIFPYISASTDAQRWFHSSAKIQGGRKGTYFKGKARKLNGEIVSFSILRNGEATRTPKDKYWQPKGKNKKWKQISLDWKDDIAVLDIKTFGKMANEDEIMKDIDSLSILINEKAKGLIIDLRNNGGGITDVANHLLTYLVHSDSILSFGAQTRINDGYGRSQGNYRDEYKDFFLGKAYSVKPTETIRVKDYIKPISCPVVILIGTFTFSAAEDFLVNLYEIPGRPVLIGEPTGGSTGAPLVVPLPHDVIVTICTLRVLFPYSKKPFVNKGIQPDVKVVQSIRDYLAGRDVVLSKAVEILNTN